MAQYRIDRNEMLESNKTIYEVMMLADSEGNVTGGGNFHGTAVDAFGRARFSQPYTMFDSSNIIEMNSKFDQATSGSANVEYSAAESTVLLNVGTASGDEVVRQTKRIFSYQPGKSLLTLNTFVMDEPKTNLRQRVGYFNTENGLFLEQDGSDIYMVLRSSHTGSLVETKVAQTSWNGDTLDGNEATSTSGIILNLLKSQIFWIDIEWLGVGSCRCGFVIDGKLITAHTFHNANVNDAVYMTTPNLPVRYEITNTGTVASNSTLEQICSTVISEGGYEARAVQQVVGNPLAGVSVGADWVNLVTIRMGDPQAVVIPAGAEVLNISNVDFEWGLFFDVTPNTAFTWTNNSSKAQYSLETKTLTDLGTRVAGGYLGGKTAPISLGDGFDWGYQLGQNLDGSYQTLTLGVRAGSSSKSAAGILKWYEL